MESLTKTNKKKGIEAMYESKLKELKELIKDMDIPEARRSDIYWLARNLPIRNSLNPNLKKALEILRDLCLDDLKKYLATTPGGWE